MKAKILMVSPRGFSPKRHYRGEGVMERLPLLDPEIQILYPTSDELWKDLIRCDVVYMFHAVEQAHAEVLKQALNMGIPVWVDYDDDLMNVSIDNPAYESIKKVLPIYEFMLKNSTMVTCNTHPLSRALANIIKKDVMVIPNAIDDYAFTDFFNFPEPDENAMAWRGGASHQHDLLDFADEFWKFLKNTEEKVFLNFVGYYPHWIEKGLSWKPQNFEGRSEYWPYILNHYEYLSHFKDVVKPWALVVPLVDNLFNRSKSNIAALEAIYSGVIPIVPNWEGWDFPGKWVYHGTKYLAQCMSEAMGLSKENRKRIQMENAQYLSDNYRLSKINQLRIRVIEALKSIKAP